MITKEILESHSVTVLKKELSKTNIKGYSKMKKSEVVALMLKPEHSQRFNHIVKKGEAPKPKKVIKIIRKKKEDIAEQKPKPPKKIIIKRTPKPTAPKPEKKIIIKRTPKPTAPKPKKVIKIIRKKKEEAPKPEKKIVIKKPRKETPGSIEAKRIKKKIAIKKEKAPAKKRNSSPIGDILELNKSWKGKSINEMKKAQPEINKRIKEKVDELAKAEGYKGMTIDKNVNRLSLLTSFLGKVQYPNTYTSEATTNKAYLDLREVFPILNVLQVLPTQIFRNLRIEIEFDANKLNQILVDNSVDITTLRPVLAVDHINNDVLVNQEINKLMSSGVVWDEIVHDNWTIPAVDTSGFGNDETAIQNASNHSLAYKGKYVERLLLCKQLQNKALALNTNAVLGFGGVASSYAVLNQTTQYRVNGKNIIPGFNGVNRPNERLAILSDEWGSVNGFIGSNLYKWSNRAASLSDPNEAGQMSWDCVRLGQRVADLQVQIQRTNNRDADALCPTNEALNINAYGEVKKAMAVMSSGYNIVFA